MFLKRLEAERFIWPNESETITLSIEQLHWLLDSIDLAGNNATARFCAHDGHALVEIGVETSEQLDVIAEQVRVIEHQRVKYACPCCDLWASSSFLLPRALLTQSALSWIITGKYQYGMPL